MIGKRFERLTVVDYVGLDKYKLKIWKCICDCGNTKNVKGTFLKRGLTQSCGCLQKERTSKANKTHGMSREKFFQAWINMVRRCHWDGDTQYSNYGGRGITVCKRWRNDFSEFKEDMLPTYKEGLQLERIDNSKGYDPTNCKWETPTNQARNRRNNSHYEYNGKLLTVSEIHERYNPHGLAYTTINSRLKSGMNVEKSIQKERVRAGSF
jgi:hypothetical protein